MGFNVNTYFILFLFANFLVNPVLASKNHQYSFPLDTNKKKAAVTVLVLENPVSENKIRQYNTPPDTIKKMDTAVVANANQSQLASDEGIKCTRGELMDKEFVAVGKSKYGEIIRITFQDLERGGREIIFQKKLMEHDEVKFYMPFDLVKEAKTAVLIVMKGDGMFFKKIDITD